LRRERSLAASLLASILLSPESQLRSGVHKNTGAVPERYGSANLSDNQMLISDEEERYTVMPLVLLDEDLLRQ
jgi:hypothetical protein